MTVTELPCLELREWESGELPGVGLTDRDRRLVERLGGRKDAAPVLFQTSDGIRVQAAGGVGVVRFDGFEVRIQPKLAGDHLGLFRMLEFATGIDGLTQLASNPRLRVDGAHLLDVVIAMLTATAERLARGGLRADYVEREGELRAIRGRFRADRQALERFGLLDRLICRYDEHTEDIPDNQVLAQALERGARLARQPALRRRTRALAAGFAAVCTPAAFDVNRDRPRLQYDRLNRHYRPAHELAFLLLDNARPNDALRSGGPVGFGFLVNMNVLFERFVERALKSVLDAAEFRIEVQRRTSGIIWRADRSETYTRLIPDVLVTRSDEQLSRLPIDAKYKRYGDGERAVDAGDLAQAFLYAYAFAAPERPASRTAMIIHPSTDPVELVRLALEVRQQAGALAPARLCVIGVHVPTLIAETKYRAPGPTMTGLRERIEELAPPAVGS